MDGGLQIKQAPIARWEFAQYAVFNCYKTGCITAIGILHFSVIFKAPLDP